MYSGGWVCEVSERTGSFGLHLVKECGSIQSVLKYRVRLIQSNGMSWLVIEILRQCSIRVAAWLLVTASVRFPLRECRMIPNVKFDEERKTNRVKVSGGMDVIKEGAGERCLRANTTLENLEV